MTELFDRFEVNRVPRWPLMSRLVALSVVLHGLFIVTVVYVPTLRGLLFVASAVSGLKLVSEDYDPTLVGQRATIVQLGPHEKLYYPPDYFGAPVVAETTQLEPTMVVEATPPPPVYRPRRVRTPRASAAPQPSPSPEVAEATPTPSPEASAASAEEQKKADAELDKIAAENGIKRPPSINTKPFEDLARQGKKLFEDGKLNLTSVEVTATAALNPDGTLVEPVQLNWVTAGDESTAALAQQLITALSQSKLLAILDGAKEVGLALKLDQQNVSIKIASELPSEDAAGRYATGYGVLLAVARNNKKGTNEGELYKNLKVDNDGKQFVMTFEMSKEAAGKMIAEMLAKKDRDAAAQNKS